MGCLESAEPAKTRPKVSFLGPLLGTPRGVCVRGQGFQRGGEGVGVEPSGGFKWHTR